jgi:hypothetical protein
MENKMYTGSAATFVFQCLLSFFALFLNVQHASPFALRYVREYNPQLILLLLPNTSLLPTQGGI